MIINRLCEYIGDTPILKLDNNFYAKLEYFNPSGSIKDRAAYNMIMDYKKKGLISSGWTIIEPTSGNLGISISMIASNLGYKSIIIMPKSASVERIKMIRLFGGKVILTSDMKTAIIIAKLLNKRINNSVILNQFDNINNVFAHYNNTASEILSDVKDIDYFIAGIGTGGTITGIGLYLKENTNCKVIGVLPNSIPHNIQGIGAGFKPSILKEEIIDEVVTITDEESILGFKKLNSLGIPVGISSGAIYIAAKRICLANPNRVVLAIFPDSYDRYLSVLEEDYGKV